MQKSRLKNRFTHLIIGLLFLNTVVAQTKNKLPVYRNDNGLLAYTQDARENRIPDFSFCGFKAGSGSIPNVPVKVFVPFQENDATQIIQSAIDYVSSLPLSEKGFRGTILLDKGIFKVNGRLTIENSGIVIRGIGIEPDGTTILATGKDRETLFKVLGKNDISISEEINITDFYVPVNGKQFKVKDASSLKKGDKILIHRPVTEKWISTLGMDSFGGETSWLGWHPGRNDIYWDRTIASIHTNSITIDAPITTALDTNYGGGTICKYQWKGRISFIGIENLSLKSEYDPSNEKDEDHCWVAISFENAADCWVRQVNFENFAGSAVALYETSKQITVEDCISTHPISEIGGQRRYTFFTSGQQNLFQRCYAEFGYHDFSVGNFAPGPNTFVQCESHRPFSFSGTIDRWASGVLFDLVNIDGHNLSLKNREQDAQGAGWTAANSMIWQCSASRIDCYSPPTATNWAFGTWGQFSGNGFWYEPNSHIKPRSLYYAQLADRLGKDVLNRSYFLPLKFGSTSAPSIELAKELSAKSIHAPYQLIDWIKEAKKHNTIPIDHLNAINAETIKPKNKENLSSRSFKIKNGWLICDNSMVTGSMLGVQWWRGNTRPYIVSKSSPHLTRFVPGRYGTGLTDNIPEVVEFMKQTNSVAINHNYGLWYDRRRDDHERIRRLDGEVCPPFYELPFARSGEGTAWDGLSKYDLTKPNYFYWSRLKNFADLAEINGLILIHQNYFQHNILEAGAHYADFPWRTANNINGTEFPEPPPYAGDKRIFLAEQFYDVTNSARKELHKKYIRQCLDNFATNTNVIQMISEEYTGPLSFVEFWLDVINEWEKETGKDALIGLSTTKDVQDSILKNKKYADIIDIIDIKYWHYREDGTTYEPAGGQNLAPRQHARLVKPGKASFESVYRAVYEYSSSFSNKAVIYSQPIDPKYSWAVFMAGGSMASIPENEDKKFLSSATSMKPEAPSSKDQSMYILGNPQGEKIIYSQTETIVLDYSKHKGKYQVSWINPLNGKQVGASKTIKAGSTLTLKSPAILPIIVFIKKN